MFDLSAFRSENPSLTVSLVGKIFDDICSQSQTDNQTTTMYVSRSVVQDVFNKHGVKAEKLLDASKVEGDILYSPTIVALLQAAASGEKKVFALIIVDVQNDFITGSLAVNEGEMVVPVINEMGPHFSHIYKTADWHPTDHISFHSNVKKCLWPTSERSTIKGCDSCMFQTVIVSGPPELKQTLWPDHCIQGSFGAEFHKDMMIFPNEVRVNKGMKCCVDSYSGFWDNGDTSHTPLYNMLLEKGVTDVVVCGIATDFCVGFTALDAARHGFRTVVVNEAIRGVMPDTSAGMMARCRRAGVEFVSSKSIPDMVKEKDVSDTVDRIFRVKKHFTIIDVNANQQYTPPV